MSNDHSCPGDEQTKDVEQVSAQQTPEIDESPTEAPFISFSSMLATVGLLGCVALLIFLFHDPTQPASRSERLANEARAQSVAQQVEAMKAELAADATR